MTLPICRDLTYDSKLVNVLTGFPRTRRLIYESSDTLWVVDVVNPSDFRLGKSQTLYQGRIWNAAAGPNYALSPDGKRFVIVERGKDTPENNLNVVLNWTEELHRHAGSANR